MPAGAHVPQPRVDARSAEADGPIVVTGGAGFIGSHVVDRLRATGRPVTVVDDLRTGRRSNLPPDVPLMELDVAGRGLEDAIEAVRPAAIVHCAANASVVVADADPAEDARVNILGTIAVARAASRFGCRVVDVTTGGALYGRPRRLPIRETDPVEPIGAYGLSKWTGERYLELLLTGRVPLVVLRLANVYGPRQRSDLEAGVIAIFLERLVRGEPLEIDGDGEQTRDFVYVGDVAEAVERATRLDGVATVNVATGIGTSIADLARTLGSVTGRDPIIRHRPARPNDIRDSRLDPRRAAEVLGWRPTTSLADGLARTWSEQPPA